MIRSLSLILVAALALGAPPALAGKAETAFMGKLVGTYAGKGTLSGSRTGTFDCTLTMKAKGDGISYRGKCDVEEFGSQSFSGDITYNDTSPTPLLLVPRTVRFRLFDISGGASAPVTRNITIAP